MKKIAAFILFIGVLDSISAQSTLTLDSCRALALSNNKELRISAEKITAAHYEKKAAFTNYLPKIAAIGTYMRTQKEISLLSDEQKGAISQIGTTAQGSIQETFQQLAASNPELAQILQPLAPLIPGIGNALNKVGQGLVDALRTDTRNMYAGAVDPYPTHLQWEEKSLPTIKSPNTLNNWPNHSTPPVCRISF